MDEDPIVHAIEMLEIVMLKVLARLDSMDSTLSTIDTTLMGIDMAVFSLDLKSD